MIKDPQGWPIYLRALVLLSALAPNCAYAKFFHIPATPLEQMSRLSSVAVQGAARKLFRPGSGTAIAWTSTGQPDYRDWYLSASSDDERRKIVEKIGEDGVARYAEQEKLKTLLDPRDRKMPTGPDSVYWSRKDGKLQVLEAKGGLSKTKSTYNSKQGTNENTIRSADGLLRSRASRAEKLQSARVLVAASRGQLSTEVVKTPHVLGRPDAPRASRPNEDNVAKEAQGLLKKAMQDPESRKLIRKARLLHNVDRLNYYGQKVGQAAGRWFLPLSPLSAGVTGVRMVTAYRKFSSGLISRREFYRSSTGPTTVAVFTATGAIVGGVFFGIGSVAGASIGAIAAMPVEVAIGWLIDWHYHDFDLQQHRLVDKAVEEFYDIDATLVEES